MAAQSDEARLAFLSKLLLEVEEGRAGLRTKSSKAEDDDDAS